MRLIDVHCHLESDEFAGGLDPLLDDARKAGLIKLITASITPDQWPVSLALARRYPEVECALGVHPWYIRPEHQPYLQDLYRARDDGAVALGEIGLDAKVEGTTFELQRSFFETQLRIAKEIGLPVVIHCRGAFDELMRSIKTVGMPRAGGVVHSYSGNADQARQFADYGLSFSLGGTLTYRNSKKKTDVLHAIYPDRLLLETDSPDIPPVEVPGRPNVPANIVYGLRAAAEILALPEEEVAEQTTHNAARVFGLVV